MTRIDEEQIARLESIYDGIERKTHYEVLGLKPDVLPEGIRLTFHALTREFHPDRFAVARGNAEFRRKVERVYARILESHRVLSNVDQRRAYHVELGIIVPGQTMSGSTTRSTTLNVGRTTTGSGPAIGTPNRRMARLRSKLAERIRMSRDKVEEGKRHFDAGHWEQAAKCFQDALAVDPRNKDAETFMHRARHKARNLKAEEYYQQGRREVNRNPARALQYLRAAVKQRPSVGRYHHFLACYLRDNGGEAHERLELLREAINREPENPDYHVELARTLTSQGIRGAARAQWAKVLQLDPNNKEAKTAFRRLK